jgi:hypothetical protein
LGKVLEDLWVSYVSYRLTTTGFAGLLLQGLGGQEQVPGQMHSHMGWWASWDIEGNRHRLDRGD